MFHSAELNTSARRTSSAITGAGPHVGMSSKIAAGQSAEQFDKQIGDDVGRSSGRLLHAHAQSRASPEFAQDLSVLA